MSSVNHRNRASGGAAAYGGDGGGGPCGACKFLRRKCVSGCIFAPYFDSDQGSTAFATVHKVFGASNVSKLLNIIPPQRRLDAVGTICFEAQCRLRDPVYGCVAHILAIQQQVVHLQAELSFLQAHLANIHASSSTAAPPPTPQNMSMAAHILADEDLPMGVPAVPPGTYDLSPLFDPTVPSTAWPMQPRPFSGATADAASSSAAAGGGAGVLQELTLQHMHKQHGN